MSTAQGFDCRTGSGSERLLAATLTKEFGLDCATYLEQKLKLASARGSAVDPEPKAKRERDLVHTSGTEIVAGR